jgi:SAM domain (Sterile alpha motif)
MDATMNVGEWLRSLGLGQYDAAFRESDIDAEVLPDLSETDLERLGVSLGHRKRLLKAIAGLGAAQIAAKPEKEVAALKSAGVTFIVAK